jgi:hypothetical protein
MTLPASSDETPLPPFLEGYRQWRTAFDNRRAGVFTLPVAEVVEAIESSMNGPLQ